MRGSLRPSRAWKIGAGGALARLVAIAFVLIGITSAAQAQTPPTPPTPPVAPEPTAIAVTSMVSSNAALANLGSNFLERLGNQASNGFNRLQRTNPGGGGASKSAEPPRYRTWFEGYGNSTKNGAVGDFVGDSRKTWGGVAGIGARVAPGINLGFSVDQSRSAIDVPLALQSATVDLTQLGFTASVDSGPWTWAIAAVHGFGNIDSRRDTGLGIATAGYNARLDGVLSEISYYWTRDQGRVVPKAAFEYVRARTGSLQEIGGLDPVAATSATVQRARLLIGAEVGHYWIFDRKILDLSAYGKFVDNLVQNFSDITVSLGPPRRYAPKASPTTMRITHCRSMPSAFRSAPCWAGRNLVRGCSTASSGRRRWPAIRKAGCSGMHCAMRILRITPAVEIGVGWGTPHPLQLPTGATAT